MKTEMLLHSTSTRIPQPFTQLTSTKHQCRPAGTHTLPALLSALTHLVHPRTQQASRRHRTLPPPRTFRLQPVYPTVKPPFSRMFPFRMLYLRLRRRAPASTCMQRELRWRRARAVDGRYATWRVPIRLVAPMRIERKLERRKGRVTEYLLFLDNSWISVFAE